MAMMDAIEQEYADEILVTTVLLKEALRRDNIKHDEVNDYMYNRGLYLDKDGNVKPKEDRDNCDLRNNR